MRILQLNRMPSRYELESINMGWLTSTIGRTGGFIKWANKLNIYNKNKKEPYKKWDEELIKEEIYKIMNKLNITRMPSRTEIISIYNDSSLCGAIVKHGGYRYWANKLNLNLKQSESKSGWDCEEIIISMLKEKGYTIKRMTTQHPYDLLINDKVKLDVKMGSAYELKGSRVHTFGINKKYSTCDVYIIVALNEEQDKIERIFIIPGFKLKIVTMSIGKHSKYNKYINKWDIIDQFIKAYDSIII